MGWAGLAWAGSTAREKSGEELKSWFMDERETRPHMNAESGARRPGREVPGTRRQRPIEETLVEIPLD